MRKATLNLAKQPHKRLSIARAPTRVQSTDLVLANPKHHLDLSTATWIALAFQGLVSRREPKPPSLAQPKPNTHRRPGSAARLLASLLSLEISSSGAAVEALLVEFTMLVSTRRRTSLFMLLSRERLSVRSRFGPRGSAQVLFAAGRFSIFHERLEI